MSSVYMYVHTPNSCMWEDWCLRLLGLLLIVPFFYRGFAVHVHLSVVHVHYDGGGSGSGGVVVMVVLVVMVVVVGWRWWW